MPNVVHCLLRAVVFMFDCYCEIRVVVCCSLYVPAVCCRRCWLLMLIAVLFDVLVLDVDCRWCVLLSVAGVCCCLRAVCCWF